jgi:probable addiction module antidote protein
MSKIKTRPFDAANYLNDEQDIELYLQVVMEDGDPALLAAALGDIARTRGMTQLSKDTGLSRESLYKSLSGERAPSSDTLFKVMRALGFKLTVQPVTPHH